MSEVAIIRIRPALPRDVPAIADLVEPFVRRRILLGKDLVDFYEAVQEFLVAELEGEMVGCGALHVMWEHLAEVRTLAVSTKVLGRGVGHRPSTFVETASEGARPRGGPPAARLVDGSCSRPRSHPALQPHLR